MTFLLKKYLILFLALREQFSLAVKQQRGAFVVGVTAELTVHHSSLVLVECDNFCGMRSRQYICVHQAQETMVSASIVTTQLIERRERSRFGVPNNYNNYGVGSSSRSTSLPSMKRISDDRANQTLRTISEFSAPRPGVHVATQSIVLQNVNGTGFKSDIPIHHLRRASITESQKKSTSYDSSQYKSSIQEEAINSNNNNDERFINSNYGKKITSIVNNNNEGEGSTSQPKLKVTFQPVAEDILSEMAERHKQTMGQGEQIERQSNEMTVYGAHGSGYSKQKVIAFVGVMPFHVGEEFETIETSGDFSNLNRENVAAIIVGNQDLNAEQLQRFNNLQVVLPLNPLHSSQVCTNSRFRVENIASNEWINDAADTTLAMILNLFRRTSRSTDTRWISGRKTITHSVLGIVGLGRVGLAVLDRARRFQFDIVFYDPSIQQGMEVALGVKRASTLRQLLEISDCITLHCPLNENTRKMISTEAMYSIKKGCFLVNNSSAQLVDAYALSRALTTGRLAAAALNYYDASLDGMWNCVLGSSDVIADDEQKQRVKKVIADIKRLF
uniref:D-isomer specific 2-hydroxyacid dehydrogenase NAD-binding domain-containing protein n=2 Tax=Ascaris TaxID=6251 RepID=A0A9J2PDR8_ASCLU